MRRNYDALRIDRDSDTPMCVQLAVNIGKAIRDGWWSEDEALPSERMLSGWLKVSRVTTRRAFDQLVAEGLIYRVKGSGSYVSKRYEHSLGALQGFSEVFAARGQQSKSIWLEKIIDLPTADEVLNLSIPVHQKVIRIKRQRVVDGQPISYEINVIPTSVLSSPDLIGQTLYRSLADANIVLFKARQHIVAMNATELIAKYCKIPVGQAVLHVTRVSYDAQGRTIEYSTTYCRSDFYDFSIEIYRQPSLPVPEAISHSHTRKHS